MSLNDILKSTAYYILNYYLRFSNNQYIQESEINAFIEVDKSKPEAEVPLVAYKTAEHYRIITGDPVPDKIIFPVLSSWSDPMKCKTMSKVMQTSFYNRYNREGRFGIILCNDVIYYVAPGIFLNSDKEVLFSINVKDIDEEGNKKIIYRVSPLVYENPRRLIEKNIITNFVPFYVNYGTTKYEENSLRVKDSEVVIKDCSDILIKTAPVERPSALESITKLSDVL